MARHRSDESTWEGAKWVAAKVDLPAPDVPIKRTSDLSGICSTCSLICVLLCDLKYGHLRRGTDTLCLLADALIGNSVAVSLGHAVRPRSELLARPLKSMVLMAHMAGVQILILRIIFAIGRRNDDHRGARVLKNGHLKRRELRQIHMLDHLDKRGRVEAFEAAITV